MLPAAPVRPLWWLARWAARLLTGLAVAAAFTLGAWALPGHPAAADRFTATATPIETPVPPTSAGWHQGAPVDLAAARGQAAPLDPATALQLAVPFDLVACLDLVCLAKPTARCAGDSADSARGCALPTARGADDLADPAGVSATQPTACGRCGLTALGNVAARVTRVPDGLFDLPGHAGGPGRGRSGRPRPTARLNPGDHPSPPHRSVPHPRRAPASPLPPAATSVLPARGGTARTNPRPRRDAIRDPLPARPPSPYRFPEVPTWRRPFSTSS